MNDDTITETVFEQYQTIQRSGVTNMVMEQSVRDLAEARGFSELVSVIDAGEYTDLLSNYDEYATRYQ